jgi:hypothetical protein
MEEIVITSFSGSLDISPSKPESKTISWSIRIYSAILDASVAASNGVILSSF